jgi:hypothetical protein
VGNAASRVDFQEGTCLNELGSTITICHYVQFGSLNFAAKDDTRQSAFASNFTDGAIMPVGTIDISVGNVGADNNDNIVSNSCTSDIYYVIWWL